MEEQISGGAEGLRGREHCTQTLSGADMGRMSGGKKIIRGLFGITTHFTERH